MVGPSTLSRTKGGRCGSLGSSQKGSSLTSEGIGGRKRPRPAFRYSFMTCGWIRYFMKSFATSTFFAPFGMKAAAGADHGRHWLAVIAVRQSQRYDIVVISLL